MLMKIDSRQNALHENILGASNPKTKNESNYPLKSFGENTFKDVSE